MPDSLKYLKSFNQFIPYQLIASISRPGKLEKIPVNRSTGIGPVSALDSANWGSYDETAAVAAVMGDGYGVGFVHRSESKLFTLDIDGAAMPDGQWHPVVGKLAAMLPGAAWERSVSGSGLHAWGRYEGSEPKHSCGAIVEGIKIELYTSDRFFALGDQETSMGDASTDCTVALHQLIATHFPPKVSVTETAWTDTPREDWDGLTDDAELLQRAMRSTSASAAFDPNRPSFSDLWSANAAKLGLAYPDGNGRDYDASRADAALAQHLAFFTGNDCERVARLMRESALARSKWDDHKDYLPRTIMNAVDRQERVYGDAKRRQKQLSENLSIGAGSEEYPISTMLTVDEMLTRYVNIIEGKRVVDLEYPRRIFGLDEWKSAHKSSLTVVEDKEKRNLDGTKKTKGVETTKLWEMNPARRQVDTVTFRPDFMPVTVDPEGKSAANTWRAIKRTKEAGDASMFLRHIDYLFGVDAMRFLDWLAHIEQRPGELPHTGWVHVSPMQGTGRNWLASVLCRLWSGYVAASFDLAGTLHSGFNGPLSQKLLAVVDEINEGGTDGRWENAETLKSLVTSEHRHINPKYGHQRLEYNACRWLIFSNHTSALPLTERDRRFHIVRNDNPPMPSEYYKQLYAALKEPGFIAGVAELLRTRDLSAFNPGDHAVMNDAKREMVAASRSEADDAIAHLVAYHPSDVIANSALGAMLTNQFAGKMTAHHKHALERAGVRPYQKAIRLGTVVSKVSILRNHSFWKEASTHQIQDELNKVREWPPMASVN